MVKLPNMPKLITPKKTKYMSIEITEDANYQAMSLAIHGEESVCDVVSRLIEQTFLFHANKELNGQ